MSTITANASGVVLFNGGPYDSPVTIASGVEISGGGAYAAISVQNEGVIHNQGTIDSAYVGIYFQGDKYGFESGAVTNDGSIGGYNFGIAELGGASIAVDNSGLISGATYSGVFLYGGGGSVTNESGGSISGAADGVYIKGPQGEVLNAGEITGGIAGVDLRATTNSIQNTGTITGGIGISESGTSATLDNSGTIVGTNSNGVALSAGESSIHNTGYIGGTVGVLEGGTSATLENAGTIHATGGVRAVYLQATGTNRLIVDGGAVFSGGIVLAKASAANTLELSGASGAGTISGFGTQYQNFQTVTIDSGATWTIAGTVAGFDGATIQGFTDHDKLDLTDLNFNAGDSVTIDDTSDVLTIRNSGGDVLGTIQLSGNFSGDFFHLTDDGHGHTLVTEDTTPCYCRGTGIRTPGGDRAVEDLRIGDLIVTAGGEALPLKWIGRRSYRDWLAVGNDDVQPILFKAGSLADHVPARDLYVSPEHAMFVDGMLVPARYLVNGVSILKMAGMDSVDYFHLEFDRHVVILAEGAMAESFVDDDSRMLFHNAVEYRRLYPDEGSRRTAEFCAPRVEAGYALEALHRALMARATRLLPSRTASVPAQHGYVDRATRTAVEGWALGDEAVSLAIVINGAVVGRALADGRRMDLKSSGLGDCSFRFVLPKPLSRELSHRIEVRRESDWSLLRGGPITLEPAECLP